MTVIPEALSQYDPAKVETAVAATTGTRWAEYAHGDPYFALWLKIVDTTIARRVGIGLFDLADAPLRDWYDDGIPPKEAALEVLQADDTFGSLFD